MLFAPSSTVSRAAAPGAGGGRFTAAVAAVALASAWLLSACGQSEQGGQKGQGGMPQMPPPAVGVVTVQPQALPLTVELPGRLEPLRTAQVRARVTGVVQQRLFTEGARVTAGQSLYAIDSAPYQAALDSALATQARAEAALALAEATLARNRPLAEQRVISDQEWVSTQATQRSALADVAAAKAAVQQARLNLGYAAVRAPISGRIGRSLVTEGALVSQTEATLLATIQQVDTMMVNFTQSAAEVMRLQRALAAGRLKGSGTAEVRLLLEDGTPYALPGRLLFSDITVDATSGQLTLRAEVPNPQGVLLPGLFVKVQLQAARSEQAMLLPQQAVTRGTTGDTVLVVGADAQVAPRSVQLGGAYSGPLGSGRDWVVLGGLQAGERVVVDGFQHIRAQTPVQPVPWQAKAASAAAGGGDSSVGASAAAPAAASQPASAAAASR